MQDYQDLARCKNCGEAMHPADGYEYTFCSEACEREFIATNSPQADMLYDK